MSEKMWCVYMGGYEGSIAGVFTTEAAAREYVDHANTNDGLAFGWFAEEVPVDLPPPTRQWWVQTITVGGGEYRESLPRQIDTRTAIAEDIPPPRGPGRGLVLFGNHEGSFRVQVVGASAEDVAQIRAAQSEAIDEAIARAVTPDA